MDVQPEGRAIVGDGADTDGPLLGEGAGQLVPLEAEFIECVAGHRQMARAVE